jgi:hypothetical protein
MLGCSMWRCKGAMQGRNPAEEVPGFRRRCLDLTWRILQDQRQVRGGEDDLMHAADAIMLRPKARLDLQQNPWVAAIHQ